MQKEEKRMRNELPEPLSAWKRIEESVEWSTEPSHSWLTRLWIVLSIGVIVWMMLGCSSLTQGSPGSDPLPGNLTAECPPLSPLEGKTGAALARKLLEVSELYYDCRDKHRRLKEAVTAPTGP